MEMDGDGEQGKEKSSAPKWDQSKSVVVVVVDETTSNFLQIKSNQRMGGLELEMGMPLKEWIQLRLAGA
ncbi:hypothetical protein TWF481_011479 [Arthrobotrys musiformis]|uniref:Uncharacterized protein n=1 Tax=Arthrobotrys musiformis TaxID=47236 RepID=A0AAV9W4G8_9PEZI